MSWSVVFHFFIFCVVVCCFAPAVAQDTSLGEVIVRDESDPSPLSREADEDAVLPTAVITRKDLSGRQTSLPEVIQGQSGVTVRRLGGLDNFATVSIRGSTSDQVMIYLDDLPLNVSSGGSINLSTIPVDQIEKIEIYKGAAPAGFPSSAIGGVLRISTKSSGPPKTYLMESFGSFTTYQLSLRHQGNKGAWRYQAGYSFETSTGDFSYRNDNGTPFNTADDRDEPRRNNDYKRHTLLTSLTYHSPENSRWSLGISNQLFREDRGIPGLATLTSDVANLSTTREGISLDIACRELRPHLSLNIKPSFQFIKEQFADPNGEIGLGIEDNDNITLQYGNILQVQYLLGSHQRLTPTLSYLGEVFLPADFAQAPANGPNSFRHNVSLGLEDELFLFQDRLILNPSLRTEHIFNDFSGGLSNAYHPVSGKMGIKYLPLEGLSAATNVSRSYRVPNFSELFGDRGTVSGNPTLRPESSWNWDIGPSVDFKSLGWSPIPCRLQLTYFLNHTNDLIQLVQTSQYTVQARNLSRSRIQGLETNIFVQPLPWMEMNANYTLELAINTSGTPGLDGKTLPGHPRHEANAEVAVKNKWGRLFTNLNFLDKNFLDTQNILEVRRRLFLGVGASVTPLRWLTASIEAKNLLNERVVDLVGFPLPGRSYYGKLEINI